MERPKPAPRPKPTPRPRPKSSRSKGPKKIRVGNLPPSCTEESLELCFESKRKFGRQLSLDGVEFDEDKREAVICYKDDEDADIVLKTCENQDLTLDGEALDVQLYTDEEESHSSGHNERFSVVAGSNEDDDEDGKDDDDGNTVEVSGFDENTSDDTLRFYFSNSRKGGGDIQQFSVDRDEMKAHIVFKDKKVVETLLKNPHTVGKKKLCVRKFIYSKTDILLKGLTDAISEETLRFFIEAKLVPDFKLVINEDRTRALIHSDKGPIDFEKAVEKCQKKPIEGSYLTPCRVPVTNCIIVTNIPKATEDTFKYYFESRKSGGGETEVDNVEVHEDENYCLVFFVKHEAVHHVCQHTKHTLTKTDMSVCPYYTSLGVPASPDSETKFSLPDTIDLSSEDTQKIKFLDSNDVQREAVNRKLVDYYAKLSCENDAKVLACTLTKGVKGCRKLAKGWSEAALNALQNHLKLIDVRVKPIDETCRKEIIEALQEVDIPDPDQVAVYFPKGTSNVVLVGTEDEVKSVWKTMDKVIAKVENKIKEDRSLVEERKELKAPWKIAYLRKKFIDRMKLHNSDLEINLNEVKAHVCFKGRKEDVRQAEIEMFEQLQQVQETKYKIGKEKAKLLEKEEVKEIINKQLQTQKTDCIWSVKNDELLLYGGDNITHVRSIIEDCLTQISMQLDNTKTDVLKSNAWRDIKEKMNKECKGCIEINWKKKDNVLEVFTVEDYEDMVSDELDTFFEEHATYEEDFKCDPTIRKYLSVNKESDLRGQPGAKAVHFKQDTILLKGTRTEIDAGKRLLNSMKKNILSKEDVLTKPGIHGYFSSEEGKNCIQRTEKSIPCIIILQGESRSSGDSKGAARQGKAAFSKPTKCAETKLASGVIVEVFGGDMTELNVDVLVNASNSKLEHAGGLADAIVRKGGQGIQDECTDRVKSKGQLKEGDVFMGTAGNLSCKAIAHALGPVWKGGSKHEEENLKKAIEKCLTKTEKKNLSSIAISALSTGAFHYPADRACNAIVEKVTDQFNRDSKSVQKVILCDINEGTVKCFVAALQQYTKNVKVHYTFDSAQHGPSWLHTDDSARGHTKERERRRSSRSPDRDGRQVLEVVQEELSKQKVDVIVNSTSKDLRLDKGLASKAISRAAGGDMQKECDNNYPKGIKVGDVAVTSGYKLRCKKVYHIAVDTYEKGQGALKCLWMVVENSLMEADKHGASSIAIPPIGCGAQKYPVQETASTMFKCISEFLEKTPNTSIKLIRLVIYTEDQDKFEVFMRESKSCKIKSRPSSKGSHKRRMKYGQVINISKGSAQFRIDCLDVNIRQGDITSETTDAIVASCNLDLDLTKGAVTKAILQKGGDEIKKDCEKQKATMKKEHIAVTKAGNLKTGHIIHIDTQYKTKNWLRPVEHCLKKAEEMGITSVAFPTLGISVGCSPEGIADVMHESLTNFTKHNTVKKLQEVRIIVFQSDIFDSFIGAMKDAIEGTGNDSYDGGRDRSPPRSRSSHSSEVQPHQGNDKVSVKVYAEGQHNCEKAIKQLKTAVNAEWIVSDLKESVILTMPQKKIDEIKREGKKRNIQIDIDHDIGKLKFHGLVKDMMPVKDEINKIIRSHEKSKHEHQQAKLLANIVKWFYVKNHQQQPFPDDWNKKVEEAFSKKETKVTVKDRSGGEYEIDFSSMTEHDVKNPKEKFTVLRRDVIAESSKEIPKTWKPMGDSQNLMLIDLKQSDPEYATVLKEFTNSLQRTPTIVKIERIQNQVLYTQYAAKRKQMVQQNSHRKDNERVLWHGTAADAVTSINHHGFNRSYCGKNAVAVGNGVYFAVTAAYSDQPTYSHPDSSGNKRMYRCLVLTGDYCNGAHGMRTPPQKQGQQSHILYDSVTNSTSNPAMFVIFHDCQAYPEHIITYK